MATFDLRKELMDINDRMANLNAVVNKNNAENLAVNYQVLQMSLKSLVATVKKSFPEYESEMLEENREIIKTLSQALTKHSAVVSTEKLEEVKQSRNQPLDI